MSQGPEDKAPEGALRIGYGFADDGGPAHCDTCDQDNVMIAEEYKDERRYESDGPVIVYTSTHKCPSCGARGLIMTMNGVPVLMHPSEFF